MRARPLAIALLLLAFGSTSVGAPGPAVSPALRVEADSLFAAGWFRAADSLEARLEAARRGDPVVLRRRAQIALLENRLADARGLLERALEAAPGDSTTQALLARVCHRADDFPPAAKLYGELGRAALSAKLGSFGDRRPYRIVGDTTSVPFVQTDPLPLIQVRVNGSEPVYLLIDTGASDLVLDSTFAATIGARRFGNDTGTFAGGRRGTIQHGRVDSLSLAGITVHDLPVLIQDTRRYAGVARGLTVSGILGTSILRHFTSTLDYPHGRLFLAPRGRGAGPPAGGTPIEMPFWMAGDHLMLARGTLAASPPLLWFVDTGLAGAAFTCPETTIRDAGLPIPGDAAFQGTGGGGSVKVRPFAVPKLTLGGAETSNLLGFLGPFPASLEHAQGFRIAGIVSHGFLRTYAMTLDFDRMRLTLVPVAR